MKLSSLKLTCFRLLGVLAAIAAVGSGMPPAPAAETITMVTTGKGSAQQWPIFIAMKKGYMADNGVTLDLIAAQSSAAAVQQLAAGSANLESGGLTDPMLAIDKGAKIAVLRVETQVAPYSLWAKAGIKSIAELRGKLISIGGAKDITRIYIERTLIPNGVQPGEYDMIFAGTTGARFAAISSGAVDATLLIPQLQGEEHGPLVPRQCSGLYARSAVHRIRDKHCVGHDAQAVAAWLPERHGQGC